MAVQARKMSPGESRERLEALGSTIAKKRDEAVKARKESGIEDIWMACEEAYLGIDDANRHEFSGAKWAKSTSMQGPISTNDAARDDTRSTAFVRLTSRYVDFGAAKLSEIALPIDDKAFAFEPTPVPELVGLENDTRPLVNPMTGQPVMKQPPQGQAIPQALAGTAKPSGLMDKVRAMMGGAQPAMVPQDPAAPEPQPMLVKDLVAETMDKAKDSAKKAEKRIWDWMVECRHTTAMRKVVHDGARLGAGVLKGPVPDKSRSQAVVRQGDLVALELVEKTVPVTKWVDLWNLFPDGSCGENIHDGDHIFERDYFSPKRLRELKKRKGWNAEMIDKVIAEGPGKIYGEGNPRVEEKDKKKRFEVWYFYGLLSRDDLLAAGANIGDDVDEAYAIVTLVNDSIIRCILNPLDSGRFPYHVFIWSRRAGHWAGVGVAEQVSMPQRMVNAATRAVLENAGISAGVQVVLDVGIVTPADKNWAITRNKIWLKAADAVLDDVRKAFNIFTIPNIEAQLMPLIEYALRLAEEHSSIPLVSMGNYAEGASPQTYGQAELQNNNAHTLLREKGNLLDDNVTEPLVQMFYEWLLMDPDVPVEEKGDFKINAHGTTAMVERAIQEMTLLGALQMALNPAYGADPKRAFELYLRTKRIDPRDVQYSEEEMERMQQAQGQQKDPRVQAAEISANSRVQAAQVAAQASEKRAAMEVDRDTLFVETEREKNAADSEANMREWAVKRELALLEYANTNRVTLEQIRADLAKEALRLRTQKELAADAAALDLHKHHNPPAGMEPPVQIPGRAGNGHAFDQMNP